MKPLLATFPLLALLALARNAGATELWVGPPGVKNGTGTQASPFATIRAGAQAAMPGDTVFIHSGTYNESLSPTRSGTATAWITFSAAPGELPILDGNNGGGGVGNGTSQFIRVVGIVSRRWASGGFGNGWVNNTGMSNGNWQFVNCVADNNGINGIAFYNATGLLIDESIIVHNGNQLPSWSSGVNLFHLFGDATTNIVRRSVSFENIDITTTHATPPGATDGSGFILDILDMTRGGALFENNLGFRNGGSCIRINTIGARLVNNTCYHDGQNSIDQAPAAPGEIFFSSGNLGAFMENNLLTASGYNSTMAAVAPGGNVPSGQSFLTNVTVNANGATPFFTNPAGIDFSLVSASASAEIDKGTAANAPPSDIGFDPKCITTDATKAAPLVGTAVTWWSYYIDYTYVASVGGVAGCFHPSARPQGSGPDIGAYEFGGVPFDGGAGSSSSSSGASSGGTSGSSSGGAGDASTGGSSGGSSGSTASSGGSASSGSGSSGASTGGGSTGGSSGGGGTSGSGGGLGGSGSGGAASSSGTSSGAGAQSGSSSGTGSTFGGKAAGCGCQAVAARSPLGEAASTLGLLGGLALRRRRVRQRSVNRATRPC